MALEINHITNTLIVDTSTNDGNLIITPKGSAGVVISSTTSSNSTQSGSLIVYGGVGIGRNVNAAESITTNRFLKSPFVIAAPRDPDIIGSGSVSAILSPVSSAGQINRVDIDPSGRFLYAARANGIIFFTVNPNTGSASITDQYVFISCSDVKIDPSGRFLYGTNENNNTIVQYSINQSTGALTSIGSALATQSYPLRIAIDPTGRFLYVTNRDSQSVSQYLINASTGALTANGTFTIQGSNPWGIDVDPTGRFVVIGSSSLSPTIESALINQNTGVLSRIGSTLATGAAPFNLKIDPSGRFVYLPCNNVPNINQFLLNQNTGVLTANGTIATTGGADSIDFDPLGFYAYATTFNGGTIASFSINTDGTLRLLGTTVVPGTGPAPSGLVVDPTGTFIYTTNIGSQALGIFVIDNLKSGNATVAHELTVNGLTNSSSTNTGALKVAGGVGVGGNLYVGGNLNLTGSIVGNITADTVKTVRTQTAANHFLAFVDSNNTVTTSESVYTTSSFTINPSTKIVTIGGSLVENRDAIGDTAISWTFAQFNQNTTNKNHYLSVEHSRETAGTDTTGTNDIIGRYGGTGGSPTLQGYIKLRDSSIQLTSLHKHPIAFGDGTSNDMVAIDYYGNIQVGIPLTGSLPAAAINILKTTPRINFVAGSSITASSKWAYIDTPNGNVNIVADILGQQADSTIVLAVDGTNSSLQVNARNITAGSVTSGTVQITGGLGVSSNLYATSAVLTDTTQSTSTTTGALQVRGGAGLGGNIVVGGTATIVGNTLSLGNFQFGSASANNLRITTGLSASLGGILSFSGNNNTAIADLDFSPNGFKISFPTTAASSTATGAFQVVGGVGIGGSLYVGGKIYSGGFEVSTSTGGALGSPFSGIFTITNTTQATSTVTGALQVRGGVGIGGNLFVGGQEAVFAPLANSSIISFGSASAPAAPSVTMNLGWGSTGISNVVKFNAGNFFGGQTTGMDFWANGSGAIDFRTYDGGWGQTGYGIALRIKVNREVQLWGAQQATSTLTGALQIINGGAGIGGNVYAQGKIYSGGFEVSTSTGAGVSESLVIAYSVVL